MKKSFVLLAIAGLLLICTQSLSAQKEDVPANKMFFTELGGPGGVMSINFDSRFVPHKKTGFGFRVGAGFVPKNIDGELRTTYTVPVGINYVLGKPNSAPSFEIGAGAAVMTRKASYYDWMYDAKTEGYVIGYLSFMFRLVPAAGGFSFRAGITPIINTGGDLCPMGAVSIGYAF